MENNKELEQALADFQKLSRDGVLPPKMEIKLHYLSTSICGQTVEPKLIESLPEFEKISLQMMNKEVKSSLFISIVRCLAGREEVTYFSTEKIYFKRQDSSSSSIPCFATCTNNNLLVFKKKTNTEPWFTFLIDKILVAKLYHRDKKKFAFGIAYDGIKYRFKFDQEGPCARIHAALLTAIRQKRSLKGRSDAKSSFGDSRMREQLELEPWDQTGEQQIFDQEKQYLCCLADKIGQYGLSSTEGYQLVKNIDGGKVMCSRQKNAVKVLLFLQRCSVQGLIQSYVQFASWNVQVDFFKIIKKIRHNTFLAQLRLKKKTFFTSPRQAIFAISYLKLCPCLGPKYHSEGSSTKHYLIMNQVDGQGTSNGVSTVPMFFNQVIEFSEVDSRPGVVFLNMLSQINFNFYEYLQNSVDLNLEFIAQLNSIAVLCHERQMMKTKKTEIFDFNSCVCNQKKKRTNFASFGASERDAPKNPAKSSTHSEMAVQDFSQQVQEFNKPSLLKEIKQIVSDHNSLKVNPKIVDVISSKIYEKYYLKQRFNQQPEQGPYISSDFHLKERTNFLSLGSRWKMTNSEDYIFIDQEELQLQKGILKMIVKQIAANLASGKSIMAMALPVQIFDDYSTLEGFTWIFGFVPVFMNKALKETKIEEQIKYITLAFMFCLACHPKVSKPFNPILGQTCEARIGGIPIYMEQISHHPPISAFLIKGDKFEASGIIDVIVDIGLNHAHTKLPSPIKVKIYETGAQYLVKLPTIELGGVMFGDRSLYLAGIGYVLQAKSGTYLEFSIGKDKKKLYEYKNKVRKPDVTGGIFKITRPAIDRILSFDKKKSYEGIKHDEAIERMSLLTGKWYGDLFFDDVCFKSVKNGPFPCEIERPQVLLPSDCTFRLDIVYRRWRDFRKSNQEKQVLENLQRNDRRLRQKLHP